MADQGYQYFNKNANVENVTVKSDVSCGTEIAKNIA